MWTRGFNTTTLLRQQRGRTPPNSPSTPSPASPPPAPKKPLEALRAVTAHENIYTVPNLLTFTRLLAGPGLAYLIMHDQHMWTLGLFAYAGLTDLLDGWIARRWNQKTVVGTVVDPMADKTLMMAVTVALAVQARLPMPLAVVILGRDTLLGLAALYYRYISLPPPKTMARYWDFSLPSAEVHPTAISKVNTALQLALIGATVAMPIVPQSLMDAWSLAPALVGFQWLVGGTTVWSGLSYVWSKDAVRIIGGDKGADAEVRRMEKHRGDE
jgi:cardiolipin synthase (CMP-forming)